MKRRILSMFLVIVMVFGMLPLSAVASSDNSVTVGFTVVDCLDGEIEIMRKELTVEPGLAKQYLDGEYGGSVGMSTEVGENDVTPIDVLVAAHIDEYGADFTDDTAENYITGFDFVTTMFGESTDITYTVNGTMPHQDGMGYAINQYIVQEADEICFYRMSWYSYPGSIFASFDQTEAELAVGEELTLKLGFCSTMGYVDAATPAPNAEIYALNEDGTIGEKIANTDENGNVTISFDTAGTYYLTCKGELSYYDEMWGMDSTGVLSPAYCKVTVTEAESAEPLPTETYEINATIDGSFKYPNSTYGYVDKITVTGPAAIKAHNIDRNTKVVSIYLADNAPNDAEYEIAFSHIIQSFAVSNTKWTYSGDLGDTGTGTVQLENGTKTVAVTTKTVYVNVLTYTTDWKLEFKPYVAPTAVTLDKSELELNINYSDTLTATIAPEDSSIKTVTWKSSDESIATVNSSGKVTGKSAGTATITATAGDVSASCQVTVKYVDVTELTLNKNELALPLNCSEKLTATVIPETASDKTLTWTSSNEEVASVDNSGKVTGLAVGEAVITVTACNGIKAECTVTVAKTSPALKEGTEAVVDAYLGVGEPYELKLTELGIFVDRDGDELSYTVSVNGAEPVEANAVWYQYTPATAGIHTLVFKCTDIDGNEAESTYTLKIHALELTRIGTYTDPNASWTDNWNCGIPYFEISAEKVITDPTGEVEGYVLLSNDTAKDDSIFVRVGILDYRNRFSGMTVNGQDIDGTFVRTDAKREWTGLVKLEWNDKNEAEVVFQAKPFQTREPFYKYTLRFKLANAENQAPALADDGSKSDSVMQYADYTVDVTSFFADADDSWLNYSVAVDDGEFEPCGKEYIFNSKTVGEKTVKFKATDLAGKESEVFTLTLNVTDYETPAGSFYIGDMTEDGGVLDVTILDNNGNPIEGVTATVGEPVEEDEESYGHTYKVWRRIIDITLPGNEGQVKTTDTVKAQFHLTQTGEWPWFTAGGNATGHTDYKWDAQKTDTIKTTLKGGLATGYGYMYETEPTVENNEHYIYELRYHIERDNNQAPALKNGAASPIKLEQEQYTTYTLDPKSLFADPEGDAVTYFISVNGGKSEELEADPYGSINRVFELNEAGTTRITLTAKDVLGAEGSCTIYVTATPVLRYTVKTDDPGYSTLGGTITDIIIRDQEVVKSVYTKVDDSHRTLSILLNENVADDAELAVEYIFEDPQNFVETYKFAYPEGGAYMTPSNPIRLVDGNAAVELVSNGHQLYKNKFYYTVLITNKPNNDPVLADGVESSVETDLLIGETYSLNLDSIFTDADGDALSYTVSINGADAVSADAAFTYTPEALGEYTLVFRTADDWGTAEATYTVTLTAKNSDVINTITFKVPSGVTPVFYASVGFDANNQDILGSELVSEAGTPADGWTTYTLSVPDNICRVSFRGNEGETAWGGMSVAVVDYEGKAITEPFVLRQLEGIINTKLDNNGEQVAPTADQAEFKVKYGEGAYAVSGGSFNDQYGNLAYRFLLYAADNSLIYTYYATPLGTLADSYVEAQGDIKTVTADVPAKASAVMKLANKSSFSITAPAEATVQFFRQIGNYNVTELTAYETVNNNDGTKTVIFNSNGGMFRVSMEGKVTKAGYCSGDGITVNWDDDNRTPDHIEEYDLSTNYGNRGNDSTYVNVNYRNNLLLGVNETFQLRSYRIWQIINTDTANIMIEPDFHYNVISGEDVVSVTPSSGCSGNAKNNWLDIKGLKSGTAVIEITYDAIDLISNGSKDSGGILAVNDFTFNAVDPSRTALIVVQVGAERSDIDFGIRNNAGNVWDVDHDTYCFTGDSAELKFTPTAATGSISRVEVSNDKGITFTELTAVDGEYTAKIVSGNNIIRITKDDGTVSHQVVRGYKITVVVSEVEGKSDMDGIAEPGETVQLWLKGYHNPIGKMSGIYNMQSTTLYFNVNGQQISRACGAYGFYGDAKINVVIPGTAQNDDTIVLEDGYATTAGYGSGGGAHRAVGGEVPPNLDADTVGGGYNIYGDIVITVGASTAEDTVPVTGIELNTENASIETGKSITLSATVSPANAEDKTVTWTSSNTAVAVVSDNGKVTGVSEGTAVITASVGTYSDTCTVTVTKPAGGSTPDDPDLEFGLTADEILGYVTVSFEDRGIRVSDELSGMDSAFRTQLGTIIPATRVPFKAYDTIASVTLRLLREKGFTADYEGDEYSSFYLAAIGNFRHNGTYYTSFGEFDAGQNSGWMITWDDWFINKGASEFMVENGDVIKWQYTCQLGADIGDDDWMDDNDDNGGTNTPVIDLTAVNAVISKINSIGTVTSDSGDIINSARAAYDALTEAQKAYVSNYGVLTEAEVALEELLAAQDKMTFTDVTEEDYYYDAVKWAVENGITEGTGKDTFSPDMVCTRAQMVTFLWRAAGKPKAKTAICAFTDVDADAYYYDALLWAVENGITVGTGSDTFSPDMECSRAQMVTFLCRAAGKPEAENTSCVFTDVDADAYYYEALLWAVENGITVGTGDGCFSPDMECTRAQMVTFLNRCMTK